MLAVANVREKLVGKPKTGHLSSDLRALGLDEGDPVFAMSPGEFLDLGQR